MGEITQFFLGDQFATFGLGKPYFTTDYLTITLLLKQYEPKTRSKVIIVLSEEKARNILEVILLEKDK